MSMFDGIDGVTSEYDCGDLDSKVNELESLVEDANDYNSIFRVFECLAVIAAKHDEELRHKPTYITSLAVFGYNVINSYYYGQDGDVIWDKLNKFKDRAYECSSWSEHERHKWMLGELTYKVGCMADESSFTLFCDELQRRANIRSKLSNDVILTGKLSDEYNNPLPQYDEDYESKIKQVDVESEKKDNHSMPNSVMVSAASKTKLDESLVKCGKYESVIGKEIYEAECKRLNTQNIIHTEAASGWMEYNALRWYHFYPILMELNMHMHVIARGILQGKDLLVEYLMLFRVMSSVYNKEILSSKCERDETNSTYLFGQIDKLWQSIDCDISVWFGEGVKINNVVMYVAENILKDLAELNSNPINKWVVGEQPISGVVNLIRSDFIRSGLWRSFLEFLRNGECVDDLPKFEYPLEAGLNAIYRLKVGLCDENFSRKTEFKEIEKGEVNKSVDETMSSMDKFLEDFFK